MCMNDELLSTKEAGEKLGLSQDHVRRLLEQGKLKGKKLGHDWVVLELNYVRQKPKRKRG
jgi:excisionase family DNA binding protein